MQEHRTEGFWLNCTKLAKGFTLIEILLAVAISALLVTVTYAFFSAVEKTGRAAIENSQFQSLVSPIFYLFLRDFESINTGYGTVSVEKDTDGNFRWVEFYTENCYYFPGVCRVKYWLYKNEKEHWLIRTEYRINSTSREGIDIPISSRVNSIDIYHLSGGSWVEGTGGKLIKVVVKVEGEKELPLVFVVRS